MVVAQRGVPRHRVPDHRRAAGRGRRLDSRAQHPSQHAGARNPERVRLPEPAGGIRDQREPVGVRFGRLLPQGLPDRAVEHAAGRDPRHLPRDARGHADRHRATVPEFPRALAQHGVRRDLPQRAAPAAAFHLVLHPHGIPAADRRGAAAAAERLLQQERPAVSDPAVGVGSRGARAGGARRVRGVLVLGAVRAAPVRSHGASAARLRALPSSSSSPARSWAGSPAARRRRSTSPKRRRSRSREAVPSRPNS